MNADKVLHDSISSTFEVFRPNRMTAVAQREISFVARNIPYSLLFTACEVSESDSCGNSGLLTGSNPVRPAIEALQHETAPV